MSALIEFRPAPFLFPLDMAHFPIVFIVFGVSTYLPVVVCFPYYSVCLFGSVKYLFDSAPVLLSCFGCVSHICGARVSDYDGFPCISVFLCIVVILPLRCATFAIRRSRFSFIAIGAPPFPFCFVFLVVKARV